MYYKYIIIIIILLNTSYHAISQSDLPSRNQEKIRDAYFGYAAELRERNGAIDKIRNEISEISNTLMITDSDSPHGVKLHRKKQELELDLKNSLREIDEFQKTRMRQLSEMQKRLEQDEETTLQKKNAPPPQVMFQNKLEELIKEYGYGPSGSVQYIDYDRRGASGITPNYYCIWPFRDFLWTKVSCNSRGPNGMEFLISVYWPHSQDLQFTPENGFFSGMERYTVLIEAKDMNELIKAIEKFKEWEEKVSKEKVDFEFSKNLSENFVFVWNGKEALIGKKRKMNFGIELTHIMKKEYINDIEFVIKNADPMIHSLQNSTKQKIESKKEIIEKLNNILE